MKFILPIIFGIIPSFVWLLFYLKKDLHPEPKKKVAKIFFLGMFLAVAVAILVELGLTFAFDYFTGVKGASHYPVFVFILYNIIVIAMVEELVKYGVVKFYALKNSALDEPVDIMIYMIASAMGFAALENILVLVSLKNSGSDMAMVSLLRFLGATFLHALASGTLGYFVALSFCNVRKDLFFASGLIIASVFHGIYNMSLIKADQISAALYSATNIKALSFPLYIPIIFLGTFAILLSLFFSMMKKKIGVCEITLKNKKILK